MNTKNTLKILTLMMTSAQVVDRNVETSVTVSDNSPFQDYPHPDDHTTRSTRLKPFIVEDELFRTRSIFSTLEFSTLLLAFIHICLHIMTSPAALVN